MRTTSSPSARRRAVVVAMTCSALALALTARSAAAQESDASRSDSVELDEQAHRLQAGFERRRLTLLPVVRTDGACDPSGEVSGRFCIAYHDHWNPKPEPEAVTDLRDRLLARLDDIAALLPGDSWLLGQRVWYRAEAGRWREATQVARTCGAAEGWWCAALEGFALHGSGRYPEAARAFERGITLMDSARAREWRVPRRLLDGAGRKLLDNASPDSLEPRLRRFWTLADPLYLVPGNDRMTAHYARRTVALIREDAANPYLLSWGGDLEDLMVRFGWEVAWDRTPRDLVVGERSRAIGHQAGAGRRFIPPGEALGDPATASAHDLEAQEAATRSQYTPAYAPTLLPMAPQVAFFPHGDSFTVVARAFLPPDTTADSAWTAPDRPPVPLLEAEALASGPARAGLFLIPAAREESPRDTVRFGATSGMFLAEAPAGRWILSVESWDPRALRAGRYRVGVVEDTTAQDVPALSDLLLLDSHGTEPHSLRAALPRVLPAAVVRPDAKIAIAWELAGLGWRRETVRYVLSVRRTGGGALHRLGRWLHLASRKRPLDISWREPGPDRPGPRFHWLALNLPTLDPGRYEIRLEARLAGRQALVARRAFRVGGDATAGTSGDGGHR